MLNMIIADWLDDTHVVMRSWHSLSHSMLLIGFLAWRSGARPMKDVAATW